MTSPLTQAAAEAAGDDAFPLVWYWRTRPIGNPRKGQRCRVIARGGMNNVLVEFPDGYTVVTSRRATRKAP